MEAIPNIPAIRINSPELFADKSFRAWLDAWTGKGIATWNGCDEKGGGNEWCDLFFTITPDLAGGSDAPSGRTDGSGIPEHIWAQIAAVIKEHPDLRAAAERHPQGSILVWLSPI